MHYQVKWKMPCSQFNISRFRMFVATCICTGEILKDALPEFRLGRYLILSLPHDAEVPRYLRWDLSYQDKLRHHLEKSQGRDLGHFLSIPTHPLDHATETPSLRKSQSQPCHHGRHKPSIKMAQTSCSMYPIGSVPDRDRSKSLTVEAESRNPSEPSYHQ